MLKKRIIATVLVKDDIVVQSVNFKKYYPVGKPEIVIENLDRWNVDEILLLDISATKLNNQPNFNLINKIGSMGISTPLTYGGGVSNKEQAKKIIQLGFERICINQSFFKEKQVFKKIAQEIGSQAVILSLPCSILNGKIRYYDYLKNSFFSISFKEIQKNNKYFSEILIMDTKGDGGKDKFDDKIFNTFYKKKIDNLLLFGGLNNISQIKKYLYSPLVKGIAIGNPLNYEENAYQNIKENLIKINVNQIRKPVYQKII
jgi:imidazole glycerol-phosphate synthase subunit HisF